MVSIFNAEISILGIIIATVFNILIGMFWYSDKGFGKMWMKEHKFKKEDLEAKPLDYALSMLGALTIAFVMSLIIYYLAFTSVFAELGGEEGIFMGSSSEFGYGLFAGLLAWFGFSFTSLLTISVWEMRSKKLFLINISHHLVTYVVMGITLALAMDLG